MTEHRHIESGMAQVVGGELLCAISDCTFLALVGDCLCVRHCDTRDARTKVMHDLAVKGNFITTGLSFGDALLALKSGKKVQRAGWNGKGMWIHLQTPDKNSKMGHPYVYMSDVAGKLFPWSPNQLDVLAEDWSIL